MNYRVCMSDAAGDLAPSQTMTFGQALDLQRELHLMLAGRQPSSYIECYSEAHNPPGWCAVGRTDLRT